MLNIIWWITLIQVIFLLLVAVVSSIIALVYNPKEFKDLTAEQEAHNEEKKQEWLNTRHWDSYYSKYVPQAPSGLIGTTSVAWRRRELLVGNLSDKWINAAGAAVVFIVVTLAFATPPYIVQNEHYTDLQAAALEIDLLVEQRNDLIAEVDEELGFLPD